jgi:SdrD B-like domain/Secretion system C-terminal sorting domain
MSSTLLNWQHSLPPKRCNTAMLQPFLASDFKNLFAVLLFCGMGLSAFGQSSPSGQARFVTPSTLSGCNKDTIWVEVANYQTGSCTVSGALGNATVEVDIPGGTLVDYMAGSLSSMPAGAVFTSFAAKKLTFTVPMPNVGDITRAYFLVKSGCDIGTLTTPPVFEGKITYPASFPTGVELFSSAKMNTGTANIIQTPYPALSFFHAQPNFQQEFRVITNIDNTGYGAVAELVYTTIHDNNIPLQYGGIYVYNYGGINADYPVYHYAPVFSAVPYGTHQTLRTYKISGLALGGDARFTSGETIRVDEYLAAPNFCASYDSKVHAKFECNGLATVCQKTDTLVANIKIVAGTPNMVGELVSADAADGCPDKSVVMKFKNTGAGTTAPVGYAYDIDLGINIGTGKMIITDVKLNGILASASGVLHTPNSSIAQGEYILKLKNLLTTDPDGAGVGIEDLDGDGFYDDMAPGQSTTVSFKYDVPCEAACGADFDYNIQSHVTFRDACNILVGNNTTPLTHFGFRQEAPIEQKNKVEYGTLTAGQSLTKNARFDFKFQQFNMDLTAATAELRIQYSKHMEFETNSLKFNGVAIAPSAIVQTGSNTGVISDVDSMVVYQLTATQITALFDNNIDSLSYSQTYYGCADRQTTNNGDFWQLLVRTKPANCSDGSAPCSFDLSCRKPFAYGAGNACGVKPCYITDYDFKRESKIGATDVTGTTPLLGAPSRAYEGDTIQFKIGSFITGDDVQEQNGYYTNLGRPDLDQRVHFAFTYSVPAGYNKESPWRFLPGYSTVVVRQRTPNSSNNLVLGTIGAVLFEAPLEVFDFQSYSGYAPTDNTGLPNGVTYTYPSASQPDYAGTPEWYCNNYPSVWIAEACPLQQTINYSNSTWNNRYWNVAKDKISEIYYLNYGKALARAGWTTPLSDDNYYVEVRSKWRMNDQFPWDNTNSFSFKGSTEHWGNYFNGIPQNTAASTSNGGCDDASTVGTVVSKKHYIANKNAVYNSTCGLTMCHKINFKSAAGDYFTGGEVRVPLKIDKIEVDLPTEYGIIASTISLEYHQSGAIQTATNIVGSASTGHVVFTKSGGGDFPRADDQSGFTTAYSLCYAVTKTGSAAATNYKIPIKIFTRDEFGTVRILTDTATIAEQQPNITVSPLVPTTQNADGGACTPFYVDFLLENKSGYDAPNVYFAAESSANTTIKSIADGPNGYAFPLNAATDVSTYSGTNLFAKLGTLRNGDERIIRIYSATMICADSFKVYADFGCTYPSLLEPVYASTTIDGATAKYVSLAPSILSRPIYDINVANLCDVKTVEIELTNARFTNINKLVAGIKLPPNMTYVAGSAKLAYPSPFAAFTALAAADVAVVGTDSVTFTYNALAPFSGICGLEGADKSEINRIRIRFDVDFATCPAANLNQLVYTFTGENYCGKKASNKGLVTFYYLGAIAGAKNNYDIKTSSTPLRVCAAQNATVPVSDTLFVKNIGGYGSASGASAATDSMVLRIKYDNLKLTMANLAFTNASASVTHSAGYVIIRMLVPAGLAVNSTIPIPFTYDMTPLVPSLCTATPISYCVASEFSAPVALSCAAKGLTCSALSKSFRGIDLNTRVFDCCKAKIGNYVWLDANANGLQDDGITAGINGVTVELYKETAPGSGTYTLAQTTITTNDATGNAGAYSFEVTDAANYYVKFPTTNATNILTTPTATAATDANSDADNTGKSPVFAMDPNATGITNQNPTIDCGYQPVGSVGNFVWTDANGNGLQDDGAASGINGVTVELWSVGADGVFGGGDDVLSQTTTTANDGSGNAGAYNFVIKQTDDYYIKFPTTNGSNQLTTPNTIVATNGNSDANAATGNSPVFNININGTGTAKDNPTIDAGFRPIATVGNYVWSDTNGNGTNDEPASAGINGLTIELWSAGLDGIVGNADDVFQQTTVTANDASGNPGKYNFDVTQAGDYYIRFPTTNGTDVLTNRTITAATDNNSDADGATGYSPKFTLTPSGTGFAKNNPTIDAGYEPAGNASAGNYVWSDTNNNGLQDEPASEGINGVIVKLWNLGPNGTYDAGGGDDVLVQTTTTASDGSGNPGYYNFIITASANYYIQFPTTNASNPLTTPTTTAATNGNSDASISTGFTPVFNISTSGTGTAQHNPTLDAGYFAPPIGSIGDYVWLDEDKDGVQDAAEKGLSGITVTLYNATTGAVVGGTTTDAYGKYLFDKLPYGDYKVGFTLPADHVWTTQTSATGTAATNSDVNPLTNQTANYTINATTPDIRDVDAGIYFIGKKASIGDYVWFDGDQNTSNGIQDATEQGLAGVTVSLYKGGVLLYTTITDGNGHYDFYNLDPANDYQIRFTTPQGLTPVTQTNNTANGSDMNPATGFTPMISLAANEKRTDIDAGFRRPTDFATKGSIGDYVFRDLNNNGIQDDNEFGVPNITVELYSTDGTLVATTTTDGYGVYSFNDLNPGAYRIKVPTLPSGYTLSPQNAGTDETADSDVNPATGFSDIFTVAAGRHEPRVDVGIYNASLPTGSIGDYVWYDTNKDGIQDANEEPVVGVPVLLYQGATFLGSVTTDIDGKYLFPNLAAGTYTVRFGLPEAYAVTTQTAPGSTLTTDSDPDNTWRVGNIILTTGQHRDDIDAGIYPIANTSGLASLGDRVWFDTDNNGTQNAGEAGAAGVTVTLYAQNGTTVLATTTTDILGNYMFTGLNSGAYIVGFSNLPAGYTLVNNNAGANDLLDSDANAATAKTDLIRLAPGENNLTVDAGIYNAAAPKGSIGDFVWIDANNNDKQDANEIGVPGVLVRLIDATTGSVLKTTMTDANGAYLFPDLAAGNYIVQFDNIPEGYNFVAKAVGGNATDSDADPATGKTNTIVLATGQNITNIDAGIQSATRAALGDFVWEDANANGLQDVGETPLAGIKVSIYDATGALVDIAITDANGHYFFPNLLPGTYTVHFETNTSTLLWTKRDVGANTADATDSDVDAMGVTNAYTLAAGQVIPTVDAGVNSARANVGNYVWFDANANGIQEPEEDGVPGVLVELRNAVTNELVARTITDGDGYYSFTGVPADTYYVVFDKTSLPPFAALTPQSAAGSIPSNDSNADVATGRTPNFTLVSGETNNTIDAGVTIPASLGDFVWLDANGDGLQQDTELPLAGITVNLYSASNPSLIIATMQTRADGSYRFDNLPAGSYIVEFGDKPGYAHSPIVTGNDGHNSDANPTTGRTATIVLAAGEHNPNIDAGFKPIASLGNYVWLDEGAGANAHNGIQDADEVGVAGVTVTLYDNTGKAIATTKTDAYGKYLFADLAPGDYSVGFSLPTNYVFSPKGSGTDSGTATDSDVNTGTGRTNTIILSAGENDMKVDAGIYFANPVKQSIGDYVWFDADNDGAQGANEKGVSGVTVTLYDAAGTTVIATTITDGNGKYLFDNLPIGSYTVGFGDMPGMGFTTQNSGNATGSDANPATGKTGVITLNTGDNLRDIDAGFVPNSPLKCAIGDKVWYDVNNDGIQSANEAGVAGVTVNLLDGTGAVVATTKTDALGNYLFDNLDAGRYKVQFDAATLPAGYDFVAQNAGTNDNADSDCLPSSGGVGGGSTTWYVLAPGDKNLTVDAGIFKATAPTGGLGNFVWIDADKDGVQDANETGLGGVTVTLYAADGITKIATTVTDKTGYYSFVNLPAADYVVGFSNTPEGFVFTNQTNGTTDGSDVNPSTGKTPPITVGTTFVATVDAGLYPSGTASGKGSLGDIVWYDTNDNGLQDATEVGVNGVTVTLYAANGTTVLATQKTDATGHYLFTGLDKGDFVVGFSNLPAGFTFTAKNTGVNDTIDTDVNAASGKTDVVSLAQGEDKLTVDAGIYNATPGAPIGAIGNFVWDDLDGDGIQNDGAESGISGISVVLYDSNNNIVATTTTDAKGYYLFPNLPFGDYKVGFGNLPEGFNFTTPNVFGSSAANGSDADPNTGLTPTITLSAGTPTNMNVDAGIRTTTKAGLGDFVWLDANANGIQDVGEKTLSGVLVTLYAADGTTKIASTVTDMNGYYSFVNLDPAMDYVVGFSNLPLGATFTTPNVGGSTTANDSDVQPSTGKTGVINLNPGEFNTTIDAGVTTEKAGLGNYVWLDANANGTQDAGEKPVAAVTVSLYDSATNTQIAKTVTDGNGYYSFTGLNPGAYYVVFEPTTLPQGATFTTQTNGTSTGSDADMTTGQTPTVVLAAGEFNPNIDAGIVQNKAGLGAYVWIDADKNGLQESTETPLPNVKVYLYSATNPTVKMDSTTTDAKGFYWFGNLTPGDYIVGFDKVTGYTRTTPNGMVGGLPTGETPLINSDANATTGLTTAITLAAGERNTSIAAGYYQTTLPVKLLYFKGEVDACTINLTWSTATEQNSKSFEVWRSNDGVHYTKIGELKSAGNSTTQKFYAFADAKPLRNNYYKLVQIDMDGASETYNLANKVSTNGCFEETDNGISGIFPNPNATNEVSVKFYTDRNDSEVVEFAIYDAFGRKIQTYARTITRGANLINLDITDLPTGVYYVKVIGNGWYSLSQKLVRVQ